LNAWHCLAEFETLYLGKRQFLERFCMNFSICFSTVLKTIFGSIRDRRIFFYATTTVMSIGNRIPIPATLFLPASPGLKDAHNKRVIADEIKPTIMDT
jgi:hypothetical protein